MATKQQMIEAAKRYAAADKSDPFAFARAMTHLGNGLSGMSQRGEDQFYDADEFREERFLPDGRAYHVTAYRNLRRP